MVLVSQNPPQIFLCELLLFVCAWAVICVLSQVKCESLATCVHVCPCVLPGFVLSGHCESLSICVTLCLFSGNGSGFCLSVCVTSVRGCVYPCLAIYACVVEGVHLCCPWMTSCSAWYLCESLWDLWESIRVCIFWFFSPFGRRVSFAGGVYLVHCVTFCDLYESWRDLCMFVYVLTGDLVVVVEGVCMQYPCLFSLGLVWVFT